MSVQLKRTGAAPSTVRLSITLPADEYLELKRLSERNRVSVAWLVRNAVTEHLQVQAPLFRQAQIGPRLALTPLYVKTRVQAAWMISWRARKSVMTRW